MSRSKSGTVRFDPQSLDATLARIIEAQRTHGEEMRQSFANTHAELLVIKEQAFKTNGRVGVLELWRETNKARLAGMSLVIGGVGGVAVGLAGILLQK